MFMVQISELFGYHRRGHKLVFTRDVNVYQYYDDEYRGYKESAGSFDGRTLGCINQRMYNQGWMHRHSVELEVYRIRTRRVCLRISITFDL